MAFDFSGWVTRNDLKCSDGRTIRKDAFKHNDGRSVPLVWQHIHDDPTNVLGHMLLENRDDGVYGYGSFNDTNAAHHAKEMVANGDITALSIYANRLKQNGGDVLHGEIREVSLVLTGANPGAFIDVPMMAHSGEYIEDEAIIYTGEDIVLSHAEDNKETKEDEKETKEDMKKEETVQDVLDTLTDHQREVVYALIGAALEQNGEGEKLNHADESEDEKDTERTKEKTIGEVFDTLTEEQKNAVYAVIGHALENSDDTEEDEEEMKHSEGGSIEMKHNVFEAARNEELMHSEFVEIVKDAKKCGSLKEAFIAHADNLTDLGYTTDGETAPYGIGNVDYLFPDARTLNTTPEFIQREMDWVQKVMNAVHRSPFSRIKSIFADITEDEARAKGYTKGKFKKEEVFGLLKRTTTPTTVYKKQKMDRDDIIDITDFDVIAWLKAEMRMMLDEEIARAILVGDGRSASDDDKISELNVRPIYTDADFFSLKCPVVVTDKTDDDEVAKTFIKIVIKSRKNYKGSGNPTLYTTEDMMTAMLLLEDAIGHKLYKTEQELATALRVKEIITVPVMEDLTRRDSEGKTRDLCGILVNLTDYNVGADKGGAVEMFEDFDIDYNQQKYLIETRCSGALTKPMSALVFELEQAA